MSARSVDLSGVRHTAVEAIVAVGNEAVSQTSVESCAKALFADRLVDAVARTPGADVAMISFVPGAASGAPRAVKPSVQFIFRKTDGMWRLL